MTDYELLEAFLNDFDECSPRKAKRLIQEHAKRMLKKLNVKEKYKIVPDKHIDSFECDESKRIIRYSSDFIYGKKPGRGISAYLLVCHECIHAKQNEHYVQMLKGNVPLNSSDLNRISKKFSRSSNLDSTACGYVKYGVASLVQQKNARAGITLCYFLQPSEFEAYKFQYQKANELLNLVLNQKIAVNNYKLVVNKLKIEVIGFINMIEESKDLFETKQPWISVDAELWNMYADNPISYGSPASVAFRAGAIMTEAVMENDEMSLDNAINLIKQNKHIFENNKTANERKKNTEIAEKPKRSPTKTKIREYLKDEDLER